MGAAFNLWSSLDVVAPGISIGETAAKFHEAWLVLLVLAKWGIPCRRDTAVQVEAEELQMEQLLLSLNVYIAPGVKEGEFRLRIMRFIDKYLHSKNLKYNDNLCVSSFFGESLAAKARDVLERLVEQG